MLPLSKLFETTSSTLFQNSVRFRYFADKPKILMRKWGYKDKMAWEGPLPRIPTGLAVPLPPYKPKKTWSEPKALFGQNDYIDILGDVEGLKPIQFQTHIPAWLRGFQGNEFQMLIRKRALHGKFISGTRPNEWKMLQNRIGILYRKLNYKTKSYMDKARVLRR